MYNRVFTWVETRAKSELRVILFAWLDSLRPINNLLIKQGRVFLGWTSTKLGYMCRIKSEVGTVKHVEALQFFFLLVQISSIVF